MTRDLFEAMLAARSEFTATDAKWQVEDKTRASVLLQAASGGPVPLTRVTSIELSDAFATIETEDAVYCLPLAHLAGLKVDRRATAGPARTGFRR